MPRRARERRARANNHLAAVAAAELSLLGEPGRQCAVAARWIRYASGAGRFRNAVAAGLASVQWPRIEILPLSWLIPTAPDTASAQALVGALTEVLPPARRVLVFASSSDKEVAAILHILAPYFEFACFTQYSINPRAVPPDQLAHWWKEHHGGDCSCHRVASDALAEARKHVGPADLLCVTGSVFLAGELRSLLLSVDPERDTVNS